MMIEAIKDFTIIVEGKTMKLMKGQRIIVDDEVSVDLIRKDLVKEIESVPPTKIWSNLLNEIIWVVSSTEAIDTLIQRGTTEVIYTAEEIRRMKTLDPEMVKAVNMTKKTFCGSTIKEGGD